MCHKEGQSKDQFACLFIDTGYSNPVIKQINAAAYDHSSEISPHILFKRCHLSFKYFAFAFYVTYI